MIGNRVIFGFILMVLSLVVIISTAPILDKEVVVMKFTGVSTDQTITTTESVAYEDNSSGSNENDIESTTVEHDEESAAKHDDEETTIKHQEVATAEHKEETTTISTVIINGLLSDNTTNLTIDIDEILQIADRVFTENQMEIPSTLTTESSEHIQTSTTDED